MKSKLVICFNIICCSTFLFGCWDQTLLKDVTLIKAQAFDVGTDKNLIKTTISIIETDSNVKIPSGNVILSAEGASTRDTRTNLDEEVSSELFATKNQITLISSDLAKQGLYALLDANFRSPLSALSAKLVITDGKAGTILHTKPENTPLISDYLSDLIDSEEQMGVVPVVDLQRALTILYDDGKDLILPRLTILDGLVGAQIAGTALFNNNHMSGTLNTDQTSLLLLLGDNKKSAHRLTRKVHSFSSSSLYDYITADVMKAERSLKVARNDNNMFEVQIELTLKLNVIEYPANHLYKKQVIASLNEKLSKQLTEEANQVLEILKESKCDYLGIGRQVQARYNSSWKSMNWKEVYPAIQMQANVKTEIETHGIIN